MASTPEQRQLDERAAFSARFGLSRVRVLAAVAALVVAAVTASSVVLAQLAGWRAPEHPVTPGFLATALGAPQADAPLVREPAAGVAVTIDETGFKVMHRDASLGVSSDTGVGPVDDLRARRRPRDPVRVGDDRRRPDEDGAVPRPSSSVRAERRGAGDSKRQPSSQG